MSKKVLAKNVDPAVTAYMAAVEVELAESLNPFKELMSEQKKQVGNLQKELEQLKESAGSTESSIAAVEMKAKRLIDKAVGGRDTQDSVWKDDAQEVIDAIEARVSVFERRMDEMERKLSRYFDKEKYAITKGIITKIMNEEKLNG